MENSFIYVVLVDFDNNESWEDHEQNNNEFVGVFDTFEKAQECVLKLRNKHEQICEIIKKDPHFGEDDDELISRMYPCERYDNDGIWNKRWDVNGYGYNRTAITYHIHKISINQTIASQKTSKWLEYYRIIPKLDRLEIKE